MSSKSLRSRMGSAVRRTSTLLMARPGTPSRASSEGDANSLHKIDTTTSSSPPRSLSGRRSSDALAPPPAEQSHVPSPIAESPAREAAASEEDHASKPPVGPSPLAQQTAIADEPPAPAPAAGEPSTTEPAAYVPPTLLSSSAAAGPGAFVDEPEDMSTGHEHHETVKPTEETPAPQVAADPTPAPAPVPVPAPIEPVTVPAPAPAAAAAHDHVEEAVGTDEVLVVAPAPEPPLAIVDESKIPSSSYFDVAKPIADEPIPVDDAPVAIPLDPSPDPERPIHNIQSPTANEDVAGTDIHANPWGASTSEPVGFFIPSQEGRVTRPASRSSMRQPGTGRLTAKSSRSSLRAINTSAPVEEKHVKIVNTPIVVGGNSAAPSTEEEVHTPVRTNVEPLAPPSTGRRSRSPSVSSRAPSDNEDPFADPPHMPQPVTLPQPYVVEPQRAPAEPSYHTNGHGNGFNPLVLPLPALNDVIPNKSTQSLAVSSRGHYEHDLHDETQPLLSTSRGLTPQASTIGMPVADVARDSSQPLLHQFGWIEYILPDSSFYYVHPTLRVTTDIDLRNIQNLDRVNKYLERKDGGSSYGYGTLGSNSWEVWLRDGCPPGSKRRGPKDDFVKCWIDHKRRILTYNAPDARDGSGEEEDRLDMEYRYWSFMEAHPSHVTLPAGARGEAVEVLTWSYTDRLLPRSQGPPPPFTQEECNELTTLLRSFGDAPSNEALQNAVHTRIISRILLRVAQSRQAYFRPNKPLPQDATKDGLAKARKRTPLRQALADFVIGCLCLGIPYLFFNRNHHHRIDEESGLRNAAPVLVVGACTCLVAAIVLSASVTFLALPGLDNISRITALVAIICSTASMASSVVALFRYKADLERPISIAVNGEGMMALSGRNIILSLPLILLVYAIISFVVGIVLYSFRGMKLTNTALIAEPFGEHTRWTVIGLLAGLGGMLTTAVVMLRR